MTDDALDFDDEYIDDDDEDIDDDEDDFDPAANVLPESFRAVLDAADVLELLSLDPMSDEVEDDDDDDEGEAIPARPALPPRPAATAVERFKDWAVLGKSTLHDSEVRTAILAALYDGIADSDGDTVLCFDPRHGIRATRGSATVEVVICFECSQIQAYSGQERKWLATTARPEKVFDKVLRQAGVPLAPKAP
jgi:hypothetical protein